MAVVKPPGMELIQVFIEALNIAISNSTTPEMKIFVEVRGVDDYYFKGEITPSHRRLIPVGCRIEPYFSLTLKNVTTVGLLVTYYPKSRCYDYQLINTNWMYKIEDLMVLASAVITFFQTDSIAEANNLYSKAKL